MVSYGDNDFKQWAEKHGFNDGDLKLIKNTAAKRALLWIMIPQAISLLGLVPGWESWNIVGQGLFVLFFLPFFCGAWTMYKCIKQGTFDNVKSGLILRIFTLLKIISYISIIPLLLNLIFVKKNYGTGINGLIKKGKIGNNKKVENSKINVPVNKSVSSSSNISKADADDPNKWTKSYVQSYENKCVATLEAMTDAMNRAMRAGDYLAAVQCCDRACNGFVLLCECHGNDKYLPKLYTYSYINAEILLFGVGGDKGIQAAIPNLKDAYDFAVKCSKQVYRIKDKAARDAEKIAGILAEIEKGSSLSSIKNKFDIDFPYDLIGY